MNIIEVNNLVKYFYSEFKRTPIKILDEITFSVPQGVTFGLLGPNGAGKTTTMKVILGLLKPSSGSVSIMGKKSTDKHMRAKIGYMPESPYFYTYLNGYELLSFCSDLLGLKGKKKKERIDELLETVGMTSRAYTRLGKCSKGMLQRIGIAQSLLNDPELVMLDEPMSGLDPLGRKDIRDIIISLKQQNKTIFFNSHILSDVQELCDYVAVLKLGKILDLESTSNIINNKKFNNLEDYFIHIIKDETLVDKNLKPVEEIVVLSGEEK
ncbi:MAG: ABC transporter ATP-binding protein [Cyanobacteriota bacterium]